MSKKVKELELNNLRATFKGVKDMILLEPLKLDSATDYDMRKKLREKKIRVNTISGGPLRTLAAMAVGGISEMFEHQQRKAALKRNIEGEEVGNTAVYLLSDLSTGVTGENIHVDAGFSIVGL